MAKAVPARKESRAHTSDARRNAGTRGLSTSKRQFQPPANVDDLSRALRHGWHDQMYTWFSDAVREVELGGPGIDPAGVGKGRSQFYNPADFSEHGEIALPIVWSGFPRGLVVRYGRDAAVELADLLVQWGDQDPLLSGDNPAGYRDEGTITGSSGTPLQYYYRPQDEYLEWHVDRDPRTQRITRVTFTCEARDYWTFLAANDRDKAVELYQKYISPEVQPEDLLFSQNVRTPLDGSFKRGEYNPWNAWNTIYGAMHLTHPANTLGAEITLAAAGTIPRKGFGTTYLSDPARLICCSAFGGENRSSDPQIGSSVNKLMQLGAQVSLQIPVALYIDSYDENCVTDDRGKPLPSFWRVLRGQKGIVGKRPSRILRLAFEIPQGEARFRNSEVFVDGKPLSRGGQLATHVHMKLIGTIRGSGTPNKPLPCRSYGWRLKANHDYLFSSLTNPGPNFERAFPHDPRRKRRH
jgi:hypothetical protein